MNKLVPQMNTHVKFQKPGLNSFRDIQLSNFSKFCNFLIFDSFRKKKKNMLANVIKMDLLIHVKCRNLIPKFLEGYHDPKRLKNVSKLKKKIQKFCIFCTPWDIW